MRYLIRLLLLVYATIPQLGHALAYLPQSDDQVLETLPVRDKNWLEVKALRDKVAAAPNDLTAALQLVKHYIALGRAESDPRYYGYAEAVLTPWLNVAYPNAEVLTLRATLYQNRHEFPAALDYLNQALTRQPRQAQAWLTRAIIQEVQGQYGAALKSCMPLVKLASALTANVCINSTLSLSGQIDTAYRQLDQALQLAAAEPLADRQWALITLAEIAERKGDPVAAGQHYRQALQMAQRNGYLLATYADFLLDHQHYAQVVALLNNDIRADTLLLRLTLAEQALGLPEANQHIEMLKARYAASRMRGDSVHQGDEARFMLHVMHTPGPALALALSNWAVQREPRDTRIVLEAALAAGRIDKSVQPTLAFLAQSGLQDARLQPLIARCQGDQS